MPECLADDFRVDSSHQHQAGERMTKVVETHPSQSCLPDDPGGIMGQHARVNRLPIVIGEYKVVESEWHTAVKALESALDSSELTLLSLQSFR